MTGWKSKIDLENPCWDGYRATVKSLPADRFPRTNALNLCLPPGTSNENGFPIRFVPAPEIPGVDYEQHILETGQVPTREDNWHDLFNALVWCRLPRLKARMNFMHCQHPDLNGGRYRGRLRDALTLLDESGVIVQGTNTEVLDALARHDWTPAWQSLHEDQGAAVRMLVCGHAILEKFLNPYKSVTAHALLVHTPRLLSTAELDVAIATGLAEAKWIESPSSLSPLPLSGLPGWWVSGPQDSEFYNDPAVFRLPAAGRTPAPVHILRVS